MTPYKLTVAPNGARLQKTDHPALPITIPETVETAKTCFAAGAHEIHLHIRTDDGSHSLDPARYRECIDELAKAVPDMSVQITTESAGIFDVSDQLACIDQLRPKAASISVREMARNPTLAKRIYAICAETHTHVQHILYTHDCVQQLIKWQTDHTIPALFNDVICVLGHYNPPKLGQPNMITPFLQAFEPHSYNWSACAFGQNEHACLIEALRLGGHVRIGFENNIRTPKGTDLADNAASIRAFTALAKANDFTPQERRS